MSRNFYFFLLVGIGLIIISVGLYYIFGYQAMEKVSVLGIVINADQDILDDQEIISELEERKIGVIQLYVDWGDIETTKGNYNWQILDRNVYDLAAQGYRVSLCVTNINGYGLGDFPNDFMNTDSLQMRKAIGDSSKDKEWFKRIDYGELLGSTIFNYFGEMNNKKIKNQLENLSSWIDE